MKNRFQAQIDEIEGICRRLGVGWQELSDRAGMNRESVRKIVKGYQPASDLFMKALRNVEQMDALSRDSAAAASDERSTAAAVEILARNMTARQLSASMSEISASDAIAAGAKVAWANLLHPWLGQKMEHAENLPMSVKPPKPPLSASSATIPGAMEGTAAALKALVREGKLRPARAPQAHPPSGKAASSSGSTAPQDSGARTRTSGPRPVPVPAPKKPVS